MNRLRRHPGWPPRRPCSLAAATAAAAAAVVALLAAHGAALAGKKDDGPMPADIIYAHRSSLYRTTDLGEGKPAELVKLPAQASRVKGLWLAPGARHVLVALPDAFVYAELSPSSVTETTATECARSAMFSPDGRCIACLDSQGRVIVYRLDTGAMRVIKDTTGTRLGFASRDEIYVSDDHSVWRVSLLHPAQRAAAAPHAPSGAWLVAPSGQRAVGDYESDAGEANNLFTFKLDGKATRRKLGFDFSPVAWSQDSQWLVMQAGNRACVARAVGGEYKCWNGYQGLGLTANGSHVLLSKRMSRRKVKLHRAVLAGPNATKPVPVRTASAPAAAWLKAPAAPTPGRPVTK